MNINNQIFRAEVNMPAKAKNTRSLSYQQDVYSESISMVLPLISQVVDMIYRVTTFMVKDKGV